MRIDIHQLPDEAKTKFRKAIVEDRKLDAVKILRDATQAKLKECKVIVEQAIKDHQIGSSGEPGVVNADETVDAMKTVKDHIFSHEKIQAVKVYTASTGATLAEGKIFVENLIRQLETECPERFKESAPNQSGCLLLTLVFAAIVCLLLVQFFVK
ncbi:hypothetical protein OAF34_01270 [Pirellulaceae bacterium]|nr:hypothetical protein [Pirellulaceae bacterium]